MMQAESPTCATEAENSPARRDYLRWARPLAAFLVIALFYLYGIDRPPLWGDEADTGIAARNTLRHGYPVEYDGRNLSMFRNGAELNRKLVRTEVSWGQFYLGALSLALFGNSTGGLRLMFAITGVLAFFPIWGILKPRVKYPEIIAALVLIAPQIVLFERNARYYSMLILLYAVLVWHLSTTFRSGRIRLAVASLVLVLLYHTQSLAALCCSASLIAFCLLFDRKSLFVYAFASGVGCLSWIVWRQLLGPTIVKLSLPLSLLVSDPRSWLRSFGAGCLHTVVDFDVVDALPILLWLGALAVLCWRRGRKGTWDILKQPVPMFILINIVVQGVATAALLGSETEAHYAILRYMPHVLAFAVLSGFVLLNEAIPNRAVYVLACFVAVAFNLFSVSFWVRPHSRVVPVSWLKPVCEEVFRPRANPWETVIAKIRHETPETGNPDKVILGLPPWVAEISIFYLGDRYFVPPLLDEESAPILRAIVGEEVFRRWFAPPEWIVDTVGMVETAPAGFVTNAIIPSYIARPDQGTRPELTRHTFAQPAVAGHVKLFRRQDTAVH